MRAAFALLPLLAAAPLAAHDFWIDLPAYRLARGATLPVKFLIGDAGAAEPWETLWRKVVSLRSYGPGGVVDQQASIRETGPGDPGGASVRLTGAGTHVVAFESYQAENDLPPAEFTTYAEHEGLTPALAARARAGTTQTHGRELYSRRAKALVQVGPTPSADATRAIGQTLELVPERNPYALRAGAPLVLRVLFRGRPLPGATVTWQELDAPIGPERRGVSDATGRTAFAMPAAGRWRAGVVWTAPIVHPRAEFDTIFASLTFGR